MKTKTFGKYFISVIFTAAVLLFASCSNILENFSSDSRESATVNVNFKSPARTILPASYALTDLTKIDLLAGATGGTQSIIKTWASNEAFTQTSSFNLDAGTYNFTLNLYCGTDPDFYLVATGAITNKTIVTGDNPLSFTTAEPTTGTGNLSVTVTWDSTDIQNISSATAVLSNVDGTTLTTDYKETFSANNFTSDQDSKSVTYSKTDVSVGYYLVTFNFLDDSSNNVRTMTEVVRIANGRTSTATRTLSDVNTMYSVTYTLTSGEITGTWTNGVKPATTRNIDTGVLLPTNVTPPDGYNFVGWYDNANYSGSTVSTIPAGTNEDKTFYACYKSTTVTQDGTEASPFLISTAADLAKVGTGTDSWALSSYYKLTADIDLQDLDTDKTDTKPYEWKPIGTSSTATITNLTFTGGFDGDGHKVSGISITSGGYYFEGFFGFVDGASAIVENLTVEGTITVETITYTTDNMRIGGVAGQLNNGTIKNCTSNVTITVTQNYIFLTSYTGGIVGYLDNAGTTIENCTNNGTITVKGLSESNAISIGGIVGYNPATGAKIEGCTNTGAVEYTVTGSGNGDDHIGGIAGYCNCTISKCCSVADVTVTSATSFITGGISGRQCAGTIINCYSTGTISSNCESYDHVGGLVGITEACSISNSYSNNAINTTDTNKHRIGGIIGYTTVNAATVNNCYFGGTMTIYTTISNTDNAIGTMIGYIDKCPTMTNCYCITYGTSSSNTSLVVNYSTDGTAGLTSIGHFFTESGTETVSLTSAYSLDTTTYSDLLTALNLISSSNTTYLPWTSSGVYPVFGFGLSYDTDIFNIFANGEALVISADSSKSNITIIAKDKNDDGTYTSVIDEIVAKISYPDSTATTTTITTYSTNSTSTDKTYESVSVFVYGGSNATALSSDTKITMTGGTVDVIYAGCLNNTLTGNATINIAGGTVGSVYGAGHYISSSATITGDSTVNLTGGTVTDSVKMVTDTTNATVSGTKTVNISGNPSVGTSTSTSSGIDLSTTSLGYATITGKMTSGEAIYVLNPSATTVGTIVAQAPVGSWVKNTFALSGHELVQNGCYIKIFN